MSTEFILISIGCIFILYAAFVYKQSKNNCINKYNNISDEENNIKINTME